MPLFVSGIFLLLVKRPVAFVDNVSRILHSHKEGGNRVPPRFPVQETEGREGRYSHETDLG